MPPNLPVKYALLAVEYDSGRIEIRRLSGGNGCEELQNQAESSVSEAEVSGWAVSRCKFSSGVEVC